MDVRKWSSKIGRLGILQWTWRQRGILEWLRYDSIADSSPLQHQLEKLISDETIREIGREHNKGRRLYIQSVNLDAQRPVVSDMGAIAICGHPDAPKLFRQVMIASASIPGAFPPQYIRVHANGKNYDEMHVDGGTVSQMLLSTLPINFGSLRKDLHQTQSPRMFIVRNAVIRPEWTRTTPMLFPIAGRAISTIIKSQGETELELMYFECKDAGMEFNLSYIPDDYVRKVEAEFDNGEMNRMFKIGYDRSMSGTAWQSAPPRFLKRVSVGAQ